MRDRREFRRFMVAALIPALELLKEGFCIQDFSAAAAERRRYEWHQ